MINKVSGSPVVQCTGTWRGGTSNRREKGHSKSGNTSPRLKLEMIYLKIIRVVHGGDVQQDFLNGLYNSGSWLFVALTRLGFMQNPD
jgi:hypothetical protein